MLRQQKKNGFHSYNKPATEKDQIALQRLVEGRQRQHELNNTASDCCDFAGKIQGVESLSHKDKQQKYLSQYCQLYQKDLQYGLISPPNHQILSFDENVLTPIIQSLNKLTFTEWSQIMLKFPNVQLTQKKAHSDMIILHNILTAIMNRYLFVCKEVGFIKKDEEIELHQNFCKPLFAASEFLNIKKGMTTHFYYNWCPTSFRHIEQPQEFRYKDFRLRMYLTEHHEQQWYFFGASIIAAFHLSQIINNCVRIQYLIEQQPYKIGQIEKLLDKSASRWVTINSQMDVMLNKLSGDVFYYKIRPLIAGFQNVLFKGVEEDSIEVKVSSTGGTGGYDPSFQTFQKAFGIKFQGDLQNTQNVLFQQGMPERHRAAILYWKSLEEEGRPNIRKFCNENNLKTFYNRILELYSVFLYIHAMVIHKFILSQMPVENRARSMGTGGTMIKKIQERYKKVQEQFLQ